MEGHKKECLFTLLFAACRASQESLGQVMSENRGIQKEGSVPGHDE